jgi:hypothetical protein
MKKIIMVTIIGLIACFYAQNMGAKPQEGYRIEIVVDTLEKKPVLRLSEPKELRFMTPEGKILKSLPYKTRTERLSITISPTHKYLLKKTEILPVVKDSLGQMKRIKEPKVRFSYINAKGQEKWHKEYEVEKLIIKVPEGSYEGETAMPYFFKISQDGTRIVFVRTRRIYSYEYRSDVVVFDTLGNEVASVYDTYDIENAGSLKISSDGKIVGADVFFPPDSTQLSMKHFFFLDVETGRTKVVKAEGEKWDAGFALSDITPLPPSGKVAIGVALYYDSSKRPSKIVKQVHKFLTFDEIPNDLLTLFGNGGGQ